MVHFSLLYTVDPRTIVLYCRVTVAPGSTGDGDLAVFGAYWHYQLYSIVH